MELFSYNKGLEQSSKQSLSSELKKWNIICGPSKNWIWDLVSPDLFSDTMCSDVRFCTLFFTMSSDIFTTGYTGCKSAWVHADNVIFVTAGVDYFGLSESCLFEELSWNIMIL